MSIFIGKHKVMLSRLMKSHKVQNNVTPAQAGANIQLKARDSRLRGNDGKG
jgi:hypothetical protein